MPELTETKSSRNPSLAGNVSHTTSASDYPKCSMRKKEKLDRQGQVKNLFGSYSPEYQQLIEGINLVLQLPLSTMSPSLPSLDKAIPLVNTQSKIFSQAVKTTASALRYVIKRSFAAFLSSKLD